MHKQTKTVFLLIRTLYSGYWVPYSLTLTQRFFFYTIVRDVCDSVNLSTDTRSNYNNGLKLDDHKYLIISDT